MKKFTKGCLKNTNCKPLELSPINLNFRRKSAGAVKILGEKQKTLEQEVDVQTQCKQTNYNLSHLKT